MVSTLIGIEAMGINEVDDIDDRNALIESILPILGRGGNNIEDDVIEGNIIKLEESNIELDDDIDDIEGAVNPPELELIIDSPNDNAFSEYMEIEEIPDNDTGIEVNNPIKADDPEDNKGIAKKLLATGNTPELIELGNKVDPIIIDEEKGINCDENIGKDEDAAEGSNKEN